MAQFQELIKNFDRIRDYMRQFYVYGFKVRGNFTEKSARTYDNERRRIESWLSGCISSDYTAKGKQISISADSRSISSNPLYSAWKSKSFTDNELLPCTFLFCITCFHAGKMQKSWKTARQRSLFPDLPPARE